MENTERTKILIVDDMEMNRQILSVILNNCYDVIEAADGLEALDILDKEYENVALIMLDIIMPVMDGFEFLERVKMKEKLKDIPIIFVTSETYKDNILKGIEKGVCDVIAKPFDPYVIMHRVSQLITLTENKEKKKQGIIPAAGTAEEKRPETVLIVDDVEMNRALLKIALGKDCSILEASDGQEALDMLDAHKGEIAVVLLDVMMPVMDGVQMMDEACRRGLLNQVPVIAITADNSEVKMQRLKELGICEVIHKPFDPAVVNNRIHNMVELYNG